jgi:SAM-dependent methyltransferase
VAYHGGMSRVEGTRSRRKLFDQAVDDYDEARPKYPERLFDDLLTAAAVGGTPRVLEIGPGTGQATLPLLERGCAVVAVELGPRLAARLRANVAGFKDASVVVGSFEEVDLPPASFDIVTAATAIHWVDPAVRYRRAHRLLRAGGVVAIIELIQVQGSKTPDFFEAAHPIYGLYREEERNRPLPQAPAAETVQPRERAEIEASGLFDPVQVFRYRWDQTYTAEQYARLLGTFSDTLAMAETAREGLIRDLCQLIDARFGGRIVRPLVVTLTVARKR